MAGRPRNDTQKIIQTIRFDSVLNDRIADAAKAENRSFSNMVETLVEDALGDRKYDRVVKRELAPRRNKAA